MPSSSDTPGVSAAFRDGLRRVRSAPALLVGVWLVTLFCAAPAAVLLRTMLAADLGSSLEAASQARGMNVGWWQEFSARTSGLGATFEPSVVGFAAVLKNLSAFLDGQWPSAPVLFLLAAYLVILSFLAGGVLDRYARQRRLGASGFFAACGVFFLRFLRLAVLAALAYWLVFAVVHAALFDRFYPWITRDLDIERAAFQWRVFCYLLFLLPLVAVNLVFDYAKIRAVVEDRHSMIGALAAGARFVRHNPGATVSLYLLNTLLFLAVIAVYALLAPGVGGGDTLSLGWTLLAGQAYVLARLAVKLTAYASQTSLFQQRLAHASYAAAPQPVWPESPAAESLSNPPPPA
jgi:hypothetical protein